MAFAERLVMVVSKNRPNFEVMYPQYVFFSHLGLTSFAMVYRSASDALFWNARTNFIAAMAIDMSLPTIRFAYDYDFND